MPHFGFTPVNIAFYLFWVILFFLLFKLSLTSNYSKKLWTYAKQISENPTERGVRQLNDHLERKKQSYKNEKSRIINDACKAAFASDKVDPQSRVKMRQLLLEKGFVLEDIQNENSEQSVTVQPEVGNEDELR